MSVVILEQQGRAPRRQGKGTWVGVGSGSPERVGSVRREGA